MDHVAVRPWQGEDRLHNYNYRGGGGGGASPAPPSLDETLCIIAYASPDLPSGTWHLHPVASQGSGSGASRGVLSTSLCS